MTKEEFYLSIAKTVAQRSACIITKTGCVIVNREFDTIVSIGYNSAPIGCDDCEDIGECLVEKNGNPKCCIGTSAIANALIFMPSYEKYCDIFIVNVDGRTGKQIYKKPSFDEVKMLLNASIYKVHIETQKHCYNTIVTDDLYYDILDDMETA